MLKKSFGCSSCGIQPKDVRPLAGNAKKFQDQRGGFEALEDNIRPDFCENATVGAKSYEDSPSKEAG